MPSWVNLLVLAIGGGMLLEGAMYALFPKVMKKAMAEMQSAPENVLRSVGLALAVTGVLLVFLFVPH